MVTDEIIFPMVKQKQPGNEGNDDMTQQISLRVPKGLLKKIDQAAGVVHSDRTELILGLLESHLIGYADALIQRRKAELEQALASLEKMRKL